MLVIFKMAALQWRTGHTCPHWASFQPTILESWKSWGQQMKYISHCINLHSLLFYEFFLPILLTSPTKWIYLHSQESWPSWPLPLGERQLTPTQVRNSQQLWSTRVCMWGVRIVIVGVLVWTRWGKANWGHRVGGKGTEQGLYYCEWRKPPASLSLSYFFFIRY